MPSAITKAWLQSRITRTQEMIVAHEDAIDALVAGAQMYQLDTGQTRQMVTKANLSALRKTLAELEARLEDYDSRLNGGANVFVEPGF